MRKQVSGVGEGVGVGVGVGVGDEVSELLMGDGDAQRPNAGWHPAPQDEPRPQKLSAPQQAPKAEPLHEDPADAPHVPSRETGRSVGAGVDTAELDGDDELETVDEADELETVDEANELGDSVELCPVDGQAWRNTVSVLSPAVIDLIELYNVHVWLCVFWNANPTHAASWSHCTLQSATPAENERICVLSDDGLP
ncbi:hypothetical protein HBH56_068590 [Parastagonospora nodorum]|nr:hypothetical protein HBH56_068590 [Parastagonospora nodorum]KAH3988366.1 hypothetical protein HBH51_003100 [Parastagonospora nodorum]KAH4071216.1 hypothetical protein HBH50_077950 [Parastagonospora nodorum]KAH4093911.1 hypothetical protein HBH48_066200 [Parastagonospora nodorum]KAH4109811.1 hypothetical protein HBH46_028990 [Parastagonospora nodorum]